MDALTQSAIQIRRHTFENGTTTLPITTFYGSYQIQTSGDTIGDQIPLSSVIMAMQFGASYTSGLDKIFNPTFSARCPSGNCTFPKYQTLTVYNECYDRSEDISDSGSYYTLRVPDGSDLKLLKETSSGVKGLIAAQSSPDYPDSKLVGNIGPLISTTSTVVDFWNDPIAVQCAFYWWVKTFEAVVNPSTNLELDERPINTDIYSTKSTYQQPDPINLYPEECWLNGTRITT
jgi:hypothetical protein